MAKKHANKKPKKKGKVIKMANENKETPKANAPANPEEALNKLVEQFKNGTAEEKDNIVFNMSMRLGQALDGFNARLDMVAGILYQLPEVKVILEGMKKAQEEQVKKQEEAKNGEQPESKSDAEPELSKEGAASESK